MRRILSALALVLMIMISAQAQQDKEEWVKVYEDDSGINYLRPATAVITGDTVKVWTRTFQKDDRSDFEIIVTLYLFDCQGHRCKRLHIVGYTRGDHEVVSETNPGDWRDIVPDSVGEKLIIAACALRRTGRR